MEFVLIYSSDSKDIFKVIYILYFNETSFIKTAISTIYLALPNAVPNIKLGLMEVNILVQFYVIR